LLPRGEGQLSGMFFIWHCTVVSISRGSNRVMKTMLADGTRYTGGKRSTGMIAILSKGNE
ncbi:MAG: hypothetical protein V3T19_01415, partial [Acidiferrobacterales bacterium]